MVCHCVVTAPRAAYRLNNFATVSIRFQTDKTKSFNQFFFLIIGKQINWVIKNNKLVFYALIGVPPPKNFQFRKCLFIIRSLISQQINTLSNYFKCFIFFSQYPHSSKSEANSNKSQHFSTSLTLLHRSNSSAISPPYVLKCPCSIGSYNYISHFRTFLVLWWHCIGLPMGIFCSILPRNIPAEGTSRTHCPALPCHLFAFGIGTFCPN